MASATTSKQRHELRSEERGIQWAHTIIENMEAHETLWETLISILKVLLNAMNTSEDWLNILDPAKVVNDVLIGAILIFIGALIGIAVSNYKRKREEERKQIEKSEQEYDEKIRLSETLLSEIKANQNRLQPFSDIADKIVNDHIETSEEETTLPNQFIISTNAFSDSVDKRGLLDDESRNKLYQYYLDIEYIRNEYNKLEAIHGYSYSLLIGIELKYKTDRLNCGAEFPGWFEIDEFLRHTKKVCDLGEELIKCLKE